MAPITREQALENALASSRIEGYEVTEQTRADCRRLMDGWCISLWHLRHQTMYADGLLRMDFHLDNPLGDKLPVDS